MTKLLLVEDDDALGQQVSDNLAAAGYQVEWEQDGDQALERKPEDYALILLDLMLPGTYGLDILKHYRQSADVPVIILSARDETRDKVRGLELGADDYLTKPFWPEELLARVSARLRRPALQRGEVWTLGDLRIDTKSRVVTIREDPVNLTPTEFELLSALVRRKGQAISRSALLDAALDPDRQGTERTLDVHMSRLRRKLGDLGERIETVWGVGYRFGEQS